ncbi:enoyl-CoA hydratase-related protein [Rhodobacter sp. SY28-1]|uniref:enoyl-CoA hydratase-related protein n=1 Tax=Rhodobacter sp. SY28-1 TaxID=2562317 RepID=UPI0010BF8919|nr:enoyl-CoA hydratase-related protein [Rhodobacter sp. SY28-1]
MSANGLKSELRDGIRVLTLANPPGNALTPGLRRALLAELLAAPGSCTAIVLQAEGPTFSSHQPLDPDPATPTLADLCRAVADSPVPVVAVLQGLVTGPGAELVLAARARLAGPTCRIAFAEVALGLCPSGGASQRLPRLIGARAALRLLLTGRPTPASEALSLGLIDGITEGAPLAPARRLAAALTVGDMLKRPVPDATAWTAAVAAARREQGRRLPAGQRIVDCVEAALLLPAENALAFEATVRADLETTPEAAGLRAAAKAERRALALPPIIARLQPLSVSRIGLLGSSPDLARIAVAALSRDVEVTWVFASDAARRAGLAAIDAGIGEGQRAGSLSPARARDLTARLLASGGPEDLAALPLVVREQASHLDGPAPAAPGAAHLVLGGADEAIGLSLPPAGRSCEVTLPGEVHPLARATALAGLRRIGLSPVLVGHRPVVGARMADAGRTALAWMISRGVPRRLIVSALDGFGVQMSDAISAESPAILRAMSATEVLNRWLSALANEGARLLDEGFVRRPSDIDYLMVAAMEFPRWRGGPMHQADRRGLMALRADLRAWGAETALWSPAPLIDRLIRDGQGFASLNQ